MTCPQVRDVSRYGPHLSFLHIIFKSNSARSLILSVHCGGGFNSNNNKSSNSKRTALYWQIHPEPGLLHQGIHPVSVPLASRPAFACSARAKCANDSKYAMAFNSCAGRWISVFCPWRPQIRIFDDRNKRREYVVESVARYSSSIESKAAHKREMARWKNLAWPILSSCWWERSGSAHIR